MVIGDLQDSTDNFEVIHFGIDPDPNNNLKIGRENIKEGKTLFKFYLREQGTRNMTVLETTEFGGLFNEQELFSFYDSLEVTDHDDQMWYVKILKPIEFREEEKDACSGDFCAQTIVSGKSDVAYTVSYVAGGGTIYEEMVVRVYIEGPTALDNDGGTFVTKVYPLSERTYSYTVPNVNSSQSEFKIGYLGETQIEAYTDPGDVIRQMIWDGTFYKPSNVSFQFKLGWSYELPGTGLSFGIEPNYDSGQTVYSKTYKGFDNSGTEKVRRAGTHYASGQELKDVGHTFDVTFWIGKYSTTAQKNLNVRWRYLISNAHDYGYGADAYKERKMYFSYWSS